jgi:hypothetical protein
MSQPEKKKKKPYYDSVDVVSYAVIIFVLGVAVGVAIGRFKHARFYFCEKRLDVLDYHNDRMAKDNIAMRTQLNAQYRPVVTILRNREPSYGCTKTALNQTWSKLAGPFQSPPDILLNMGGLSLNVTDSSNTKFYANSELIRLNQTINITSVDPAASNINLCWIAHPTNQIE